MSFVVCSRDLIGKGCAFSLEYHKFWGDLQKMFGIIKAYISLIRNYMVSWTDS